jgi:hypothetical protein
MDSLNLYNIGEPVALIGRANLFGKTGVVSARIINKNKKLKYKVRVGKDTLTLPPRSLKRIVKSPTFELDEYEIEIVNYCENFKENLLEKYRKGKIEHGGKPVKIDCGAEIAKEVYDAIIYHRIHLVNERG